MNNLDRLQHLLDLAAKAGATSADALMFEGTALSVSRRMGKPEGLEREERIDMGLRVFVGQSQAIVSTTDPAESSLKELAERAVSMAKVAPQDSYAGLAPEEFLARDIPKLELCDPEEPTPEWLQEQCAKAEDAALQTTGITNSEGASAGYGRTLVQLATSHEFAQQYTTGSFSLSISVIAGNGEHMETDYDYTAAIFSSDLKPAEEIGRSAAQKALRRLSPHKIVTCQVPVIFDPRVGRTLLSAFAGAINGGAIARGTSFLKDSMGKKIFHEHIHIIDDPLIPRGLGSHPFDAEGVKVQQRLLVEDGILCGWLLDTRSANRLGLVPTGNASRGVASPPSPATSNFYMKPGEIGREALIGNVKQGLYVTEVFGMGVNIITGDYSQGAAGFWIENGELGYPVSELTIAGKLSYMFQMLTPADDLVLRYATNTPTFMIEGMTVAGK